MSIFKQTPTFKNKTELMYTPWMSSLTSHICRAGRITSQFSASSPRSVVSLSNRLRGRQNHLTEYLESLRIFVQHSLILIA